LSFVVAPDVVRRPATPALDALDIGHRQPEQEEVLHADLVAYLHVGTIERADGAVLRSTPELAKTGDS
jgi:hypothetical protein